MCSNVHQLLLPGLAIDEIAQLPDGRLEIGARCLNLGAACPICSRMTMRIHSGSVRTLRDLPLRDHHVTLKVHVQHFRCAPPDCPRAIFAEPLTRLAFRYARRTPRVTTTLKHLGVNWAAMRVLDWPAILA